MNECTANRFALRSSRFVQELHPVTALPDPRKRPLPVDVQVFDEDAVGLAVGGDGEHDAAGQIVYCAIQAFLVFPSLSTPY